MKANQSNAIDRAPSLRRRIGAAACAGALGLLCLPLHAWASDNGTTQVTVEADPSSMILYEVPTKLPFYAAADGTLTGPSPSACQIVNKSVFGIHVTEVSVTPSGNWNIAADATKGEGQNIIDFQFGPKTQIDAYAAMSRVDVSSDASFNMEYKGSGKETVSINSAGNVARLTHDITSPVPAATISWTVAAGSASGTPSGGSDVSGGEGGAPSAGQQTPSSDDQPTAGAQQPSDADAAADPSEPAVS